MVTVHLFISILDLSTPCFTQSPLYQSHSLPKGLFLVKFEKNGSNLRPPIVFGCKVSFNGRFESYLADIKLRSLLEFFL